MPITRADIRSVPDFPKKAPTVTAGTIPLYAVGLLLACTVSSRAHDCTSGYRALAGVQGLLLHERVCTLDGGSSNILRVTFARLDEELAGNLARNEKTPELEQLFPNAHLVDNEVSSELRILFQYAHKTTVPARNMALFVTVSAPHGETFEVSSATLSPLNASQNETRRLWSISSDGATFGERQNYAISSNVVDRAIRNTTGWPDGFKFFYICQSNIIECTQLWRYLGRASDLDALEHDTDRDLVASNSDPRIANRDKSDWVEDHDYIYKTHFALFRYLAQRGWPERFLVIRWDVDFCGGAFIGYYVMPPLSLDVAIVENGSPETIRIKDIIGAMDTTAELRASTGQVDAAGPLHVGEIQVPPGGRLTIPLRITFLGGATEEATSDAQKMYQQITSRSPNAMITLTNKQATPWFTYRKRASSFKPPELPESKDYQFGPQLHLRGFLIENQDLQIDHTAPNLITLNGNEALKDARITGDKQADVVLSLHENNGLGGSCPILYVWNEATAEWVNLGKVIHEANGEDHEATSMVSVTSDARRFRLAEQEPEVASIREAQLILTLRDGRRVSIEPDQSKGATFPRKIPAYTSTSFTYSVPQAYIEAGITRAELAVTGFYNRNSAILASQALRPDLLFRRQRP
jgi:hypothetical protein